MADVAGPTRVVLAGAGRFGALHARTWSEAGARIVGVVDPDARRAEALAARHGASFGSELSEVLQPGSADAVVVASTEDTHVPLALEALRAGCHVFVEKPFAMRPADAAAVVATAEARGLTAFAGHVSRFAQPYVRLRDAVDAGRLGTLWTLRLRRDFSRAWFESFGDRVDPVWESCIHDVDLAIYLASARPVRVVAQRSAAAGRAAASVVSALVAFDSGVTATIESAWAVPDGAPGTLAGVLELDGTIAAECEVIGSRGVAKQRLVNDSLTEWTDTGATTPDLTLWPEVAGRVGGALAAEVTEALAVFRGERPPARMPHREALWSVELAAAIVESAESGAVVTIPG
ncbi:MAG: Gfo/Idh/MocA family oxidoreductase [Salana multivorans]|uniref:Gfo/Idh/MocA family protein n=1 Tax=Salana multivorans TaxID=120377 RepID=UPI00095DEA34|nr:Gfo/Idh/MocA family oxidoreductase [Salana multivorans]MBN8882467.1 Gfo/Idh/MocA family oxidoreductase [Salana multivorans]OJX97478.1 MAG: hypothetical protein BGO96_06145 [Micrococcales bacterium 73-15]